MRIEQKNGPGRSPKNLAEAVTDLDLLLKLGFNYWEPDYALVKDGVSYTLHTGQRITVRNGAAVRLTSVIGYPDLTDKPPFYFRTFFVPKALHAMSTEELRMTKVRIMGVIDPRFQVEAEALPTLLTNMLRNGHRISSDL